MRIVQPVEKVYPTRSRRRKADSQLSCELRVADRREGGTFFMAYQEKFDSIASRSKSLHHPIDPIARETEDDLYSPVDQPVGNDVRRIHMKSCLSPLLKRWQAIAFWTQELWGRHPIFAPRPQRLNARLDGNPVLREQVVVHVFGGKFSAAVLARYH